MYVIVVGAGHVGYFLTKKLAKDKHIVALIEKDKTICEKIAQEFDILVIHGDASDIKILENAGISRADVIAVVTGNDEDNLIISQLAKERFKVARTVARVNDSKNEHLFVELGVDVPVDATTILAKIIEEEVSFSDFVNLLSFKRGRVALVRVDLTEESPVINKKVKEINLPSDSVLVSIIRKDEVLIPTGNTILKTGDDVVAITLVENEQQMLKTLLGKL
ncbi:MAG: NAD-binding protein [Candidatus Omnitrophota bacterium]